MQVQQTRPATHLVLLGAGHAHVEVLRRLARRPIPARVTLIAREALTPYSGMLPGLIRGEIAFADAHIDCAKLAAAAGAAFIVAEAHAIDLAARRVSLTDGTVPFDLLSLDVGGAPEVPSGGIGVKPIGRFLEHLPALRGSIAVVGGGPGGVELALALAHRGLPRVSLIGRNPTLLPATPARARRIAAAALAAMGVRCVLGAPARGDEAETMLWATGTRAPAFLRASGLDCDQDGCVRVAPTLRSLSHDRVFAAGDCAALGRPKSGVWAVRAGAPLAENLRRAVAGQDLRPWHPQRDALAILGLGGGRAVAWRGGLTLDGRLAYHLKIWLDRRWMARFPQPR